MREPELQRGKTYEHTYGGWIKFFRDCAEDPSDVWKVPATWAPFLTYLGCKVLSTVQYFNEDALAPPPYAMQIAQQRGRLRELVEWVSSMRPELVDSLYKSDIEWAVANRQHTWRNDFNVTCNGSFFRPEVLAFIDKLRKHTPKPAELTVIMPCAADKPYPAPLHRMVSTVVRTAARYTTIEYVIATGVLGLIPQDLWDEAPRYDSGLPNEERVYNEATRYFRKLTVKDTGRIIVYSDFYAPVVMDALLDVGHLASWPVRGPVEATIAQAVHPEHAHVEYIDLMAPQHLMALRDEVNRR